MKLYSTHKKKSLKVPKNTVVSHLKHIEDASDCALSLYHLNEDIVNTTFSTLNSQMAALDSFYEIHHPRIGNQVFVLEHLTHSHS